MLPSAQPVGELGVSPHHEKQLVELLRFWRYQRGGRLRAVAACFEQMQRTRLNDATYTKDELLALLRDLKEIVEAETASELLNASHTAMLLVRQLCGQADQWHLRLQVDLNELQSKELLDAVGSYEKQHIDAIADRNRPQITVLKTLAPLAPPPADDELHTEMERLRAENARLQLKLAGAEKTVAEQSDRHRRQSDADNAKNAEAAVGQAEDNSCEWQSRVDALQSALSDAAASKESHEAALHNELTEAHKQLLGVKAQLDMAETELEKKFSQTNAYKNMKLMLVQKNKLIKDIRARLKQYEPEQDAVDDD